MRSVAPHFLQIGVCRFVKAMQTNVLISLVLQNLFNVIISSLLPSQRGTREVSILPVALTINTEAASNGGFLASFGLSSLKGNKPSYVLRTKIFSKIHPFEVLWSFKIINFGSVKAKTQVIW